MYSMHSLVSRVKRGGGGVEVKNTFAHGQSKNSCLQAFHLLLSKSGFFFIGSLSGGLGHPTRISSEY